MSIPSPTGVIPPTAEAIQEALANEQDKLWRIVDAEVPTLIRLKRSVTLGQLALALSRAQGAMSAASRDAKNPFFKSSYASLSSVWDACREPLAQNELAIIQGVSCERGRVVTITTLLVHSSGQWVEHELTLVAAQDTPQAVGSTITYGRRYGLSAAVGIAPKDDDGEAGTHSLPQGVKWDKASTSLQPPAGPSDELKDPEPAAPAHPAGASPAGRVVPSARSAVPPPPGMRPPARMPEGGSKTSP